MLMMPMMSPELPTWPLLAVGIVGLVLGFAIILWITRDPEEGSDHWRSHR